MHICHRFGYRSEEFILEKLEKPTKLRLISFELKKCDCKSNSSFDSLKPAVYFSTTNKKINSKMDNFEFYQHDRRSIVLIQSKTNRKIKQMNKKKLTF